MIDGLVLPSPCERAHGGECQLLDGVSASGALQWALVSRQDSQSIAGGLASHDCASSQGVTNFRRGCRGFHSIFGLIAQEREWWLVLLRDGLYVVGDTD